MGRFDDLSLQRKLLGIIMLTTVLALILATGAVLAYDAYSFRARLVDELETLAATLQPTIRTTLVYNDSQQAGLILNGLAAEPVVISAMIFDADGKAFAEFHRQGVEGDTFVSEVGGQGHAFVKHDGQEDLVVQRPLRFNNRPVGTFQIRADLSETFDRLRNFSLILGASILGASILALFFSTRLQRLVSRPILELAGLARTVSEKQDYTVRAKAEARSDEIGRLVNGFNEMLAQIQQRDEELNIARDKAEEANRTKSVFLANMSHELRTPLTAIIGYSEILEDDARDLGMPDFLPDLQKIRAAGKHLLGLINNILDLSKVEAGKMELFIESFDVPLLVQDVASTVAPLMDKRGNTLEIQCPKDLGALTGDETKIRQILFNLLSNASKFTDRGRVLLKAEHKVAQGIDGFLFQIRDTGIGMTPEQMERLFKPFSQADASTARNFGGTGLGLALCKRFCQIMGGRIDVQSEYGSGTSFTVWLPAVMEGEKAKTVHQLLESGEWRFGTPRPGSSPQLDLGELADSKLALVVDDDLAVHELLGGMLQKEGFRVATATHGAEGLRLAREMKPDLITLDVYMPGQDGWEVLSEIKGDATLADTPVIMISVSDQRQKGYALGADYLTKPIDRQQLATLLERYRGPADEAPLCLVVDDDEDLRSVARHQLEDEGWRVVEAENGVAALRRIAEEVPSLILLDLIMPQLDGFGLLAQLRKSNKWRDVPVVVLTAMDLGPEERERLSGGVERVLQKGAFDLDELQEEIRALAAGR